MTDFNPPTTAWHVIHIEEDRWAVKVKLERVAWSLAGSDDDEWIDAQPGEPGATWIGENIATVLTFDPDDAHGFEIGQHYTLGLSAVQDAAVMQA